MSDNIPFEIQEQIIKRFPVESLIRFRSVSKQWKSLIDSSEFITDHSVNQTQPPHLLLKYYAANKIKCVSIVDDDTFPHHKFSPPIELLTRASLLDCSHGLVCLHGFSEEYRRKLIVLFNPSIRKSVGIVVPDGLTAVGVGVCPKTSDPKIVRIIDRSTVDWKAEVFTLSTGTWRSVSVNLRMPFELIAFDSNPVVINGIIYWFAYSLYNVAYSDVLIISFDLTSEEFGEVALPDGLAKSESGNLFIGKMKESLVLLDYIIDGLVCDVWMMIENGSFTKVLKLDFKTLDNSVFYDIIGFRMNGQVIMEHVQRLGAERLKVYEPCSKHINELEIDATGDGVGFEMASYTESLLLLNHSASIIQ